MNNVIKYKTKLNFIADGENKEFNFNFQIFGTENVTVYLDSVLQTEGFVVVLDEVGGRIIFSTPPAKDVQVTIIRNLPVKRVTDFQEGGPFRASRVNGEFDYQVACLEQIEEKLSRVIYKPPYLIEDSNLSLPEPISGRTLIWSEDNSGLKNSKYDVDNLENQLSSAVADVNDKWKDVLEKSEKVDYTYNHIIPNSHTLGEIFTDGFVELLDGQGWCQGGVLPSGVYSGLVAEFDKYSADNSKGIAHISFTTYEASLLANNDNCLLFGYDAVANLIRLPRIKSGVGIFQAENDIENNRYYPDQIQNITGDFDGLGGDGKAFKFNRTGGFQGGSFNVGHITFNVAEVARTGDDTRNKQIRRRFKVQLANVGGRASESNYNEFINGLTNKADKDLRNISTNIDYVVDSWVSGDGKSWYRLYKSGFKEQGGIRESTSSGTINFHLPFTKTPNVQRTNVTTSTGGLVAAGAGVNNITLTSFYLLADGGIPVQNWEAKGV